MDGLYTLPPPPTFLLVLTYFYCKKKRKMGAGGGRETEVTVQRTANKRHFGIFRDY